MSEEPLLQLNEVSVHYGRAIAIASINLTMNKGDLVAVIGPNGTGKTTLMKAISGLVELENGEIIFENQVIAEMAKSDFRKISRNRSLKPHDIVKKGIIHCPERRMLFSESTVKENLELGAFTCDDKREIEDRLERVINLFPILGERLHDEAGKFSGGQQQMIAIGRSLMGNPKLLLLDEPSLGLAPIVKQDIVETIKKINKTDSSISILIVEQDITMAFEIANRGYVMENGRIEFKGTREEILNNPYVRKAYLGL